MAEEEHRPTLLLVGQGEPMQAALGEALRRHGISVAASATDELETAVRVYAPDLVVLIGDASVRGGAGVVQRMAANRATDVLPIAVVSNDAVLKHEGPDFRTGAVAIVPRGAGADTIARRLAELAREVPDRPGIARGELTEENLKDVVALVSSDHKTGILSIRSPRGAVEGIPMVIETESPSAHNMEAILERLREAVDRAEPLQYEFHEASGGRLSTLPAPMESIRPKGEARQAVLQGTRMVILDSEELRAERFANVLYGKGVRVAAADFSTAVIPRIREVDPQIIVMDSTAVGGQGIEFVRAIRKDPQLRWASMLVVRWEDFWPSDSEEAEPDLAQLGARIKPLVEQDAEIARRVTDEIDFDTRLELIGPGRLLRALGSVPGVRHVSVGGNKRNIELDIADNAIVGAYATIRDESIQSLQGLPALTALWGMNSGRVSVREQDLPSVANLMMPVDEALGVVARELGRTASDDGATGDAPTMPPATPAVQDTATMPPGAMTGEELDELRTMAPPRFRHLQAAAGSVNRGFSEEEVPTNKMPQLLARVETQRRALEAAGGVVESNGPDRHTDHGAIAPLPRRKPKRTQAGLAPAFEVLPDAEVPAAELAESTRPRQPTPPPPPIESRRASRGPLFTDDALEQELAPMLEGPATILAPGAPKSPPTWISVLLLVALLGGGGLLLWQWLMSPDSDVVVAADTTAEPAPEATAEAPVAASAEARDDAMQGALADDELPLPEPSAPGPGEAEAETAEAETAEPAPEGSEDTGSGSEAKGSPDEAEPAAPPAPSAAASKLAIPTQNLPRDPSKASDVLVHRALPLIRRGELRRAEATLDRAWELDPKNPQAMAGYASLYVKAKDGERAEKWAERAVARRPRRVQYRIVLGDALMLQGKERQARRVWRKALAQDPNNRAARARLAASED